MALIGAYSVYNKTPGRALAGNSTAGEANTYSKHRSNWGGSGANQNKFFGWAGIDPHTAVPNGYVAPYCWTMATKAGGLATYNTILGDGDVTGANLAGGRNAQGALTGDGGITNADAKMVLQAVAALSGLGGVTANITGKLEAAGALAASGNIVGALTALAEAVAALTGSGAPTGTLNAKGALAADIVVTGDILTTANVAASVWNALAATFNESGTMGGKMNSALSLTKFLGLK